MNISFYIARLCQKYRYNEIHSLHNYVKGYLIKNHRHLLIGHGNNLKFSFFPERVRFHSTGCVRGIGE